MLSLLYCFCINKVLRHDDNRLMRHKVLPFGLFALGLQSDLMEETSSAEDSFYSDLCGRSREVYIGCFSLFFSTELKEKIGQPTRSVFFKGSSGWQQPLFHFGSENWVEEKVCACFRVAEVGSLLARTKIPTILLLFSRQMCKKCINRDKS